VVNNYIRIPTGNLAIILAGVLLVSAGIVVNAIAYRRMSRKAGRVPVKGLVLSVIAGVLMAQFYGFVVDAMAQNYSMPEPGKLTPYTALVVFSVGILFSNLVFNTVLMRRPLEGDPVTYSAYFRGNFVTHLTGVLGGLIWCTGMIFSIIAAEKAGPAISYGLGQGAVLVAAFWGVFVWKEFKPASRATNILLAIMFLCFFAGLGLIVYSKVAAE
jgi:glucose uptake protein